MAFKLNRDHSEDMETHNLKNGKVNMMEHLSGQHTVGPELKDL